MTYVALTCYRHSFWVPVGRGTLKQAVRYADTAERSRSEETRVLSEQEWDKEQASRKRERLGFDRDGFRQFTPKGRR